MWGQKSVDLWERFLPVPAGAAPRQLMGERMEAERIAIEGTLDCRNPEGNHLTVLRCCAR